MQSKYNKSVNWIIRPNNTGNNPGKSNNKQMYGFAELQRPNGCNGVPYRRVYVFSWSFLIVSRISPEVGEWAL